MHTYESTCYLQSLVDKNLVIESHTDENGLLHREVGPALILSNGRQEWYIHGLLHREGGPAIISGFGLEIWYQDGLRHRADGPAVINRDTGIKHYWLYNHPYRKKIYWFEALSDKQKVAYMFTESFAEGF